MGGVFSAPKTSAPAVVENNDAEKLAEEERQKALERQRRGVESTIKTSYNGLLDTKDLNRKKLLGE